MKNLPDFNEWGVNCESCRYARKTGRAPLLSQQLARKHAHANPEHVVQVIEYVVRATWGGYTPKLVDLDSEDAPPF